MFRCFDIIAAAAYAAEEAANGHERGPWDELTDDERNVQVQRVMAVARGEIEGDPKALETFEATASAILGFNGGQGALALEEIAALGGRLIDLGLVTEEEASKGGSICGHAIAQLEAYAALLASMADEAPAEAETVQ